MVETTKLAEGVERIDEQGYKIKDGLKKFECPETALIGQEYIARIEFDIVVRVLSKGDVIYEVPFKSNITIRRFEKHETLHDYQKWKKESVEAVKKKAENIMIGWDASDKTSYEIELVGKIREVKLPLPPPRGGKGKKDR